jgi:hypothetical protein
MGPPGSGKSTVRSTSYVYSSTASGSRTQFIEHATRQHGQIVSHGLQPCVTNIQTFRTNHPTDGLPVVFVDAPGSDDETWSVKEVLSEIAAWLVKS